MEICKLEDIDIVTEVTEWNEIDSRITETITRLETFKGQKYEHKRRYIEFNSELRYKSQLEHQSQ